MHLENSFSLDDPGLAASFNTISQNKKPKKPDDSLYDLSKNSNSPSKYYNSAQKIPK